MDARASGAEATQFVRLCTNSTSWLSVLSKLEYSELGSWGEGRTESQFVQAGLELTM